MDTSWVLKVALSRLPPERTEKLQSHLQPSLLEKLKKLPSPPEKPKTPLSLLTLIHWSWFLPPLEHYTKEEQKLFLAILPKQTRNRLNQEIGLPPLPPAALKTSVRLFLEKELICQIGKEILPPSFLPPSPLNHLLFLSKKEFIQLIDLVSLFDLMVELKQIVETKILRKIYSFLSEEEKKFLKTIAPSPPLFPLRWEDWDGTKESFRHLLHKRGLQKFGFALAGMEGDLSWYLAHLLDVGRGALLLKASKLQVPDAAQVEILSQINAAFSWKTQEEF